MQETAATLYREQTLMAIEEGIASVKEIFRLQNADELKEAEQIYLPPSGVSSGD
jgi:phosphoenolpyruvate phosphomutase